MKYFLRLLPNGRVFIRNIDTNEITNLDNISKLAGFLESDETEEVDNDIQ